MVVITERGTDSIVTYEVTPDGTFGASSDGRFLYAIDADSGRIHGWSVHADGALEPIGSWEGVPKTVAGLAAS
jgi:6-phosphogluconolactonase (cycloisomerase 2 family)